MIESVMAELDEEAHRAGQVREFEKLSKEERTRLLNLTAKARGNAA